MPRILNITGQYPADWKEISDATWAAAGHRCIRCGHPYRKGEHGKGEWTPCDERCTHGGPIAIKSASFLHLITVPVIAGELIKKENLPIAARWRIGTVHHLDGNKANCVWWNLLALCQRCHLTIQSRVDPEHPYFLEHSGWFKPYAAGFYAKKYLKIDVTRKHLEDDPVFMETLLGIEKLA